MRTAIVLLAASIAFATPALAGPLQRSAENQERRIERGVESGELTNSEAKRLEHRNSKIQADIDAAKADGKMTPKEIRKIKNAEKRQNANIYHKKHNERKAQ